MLGLCCILRFMSDNCTFNDTSVNMVIIYSFYFEFLSSNIQPIIHSRQLTVCKCKGYFFVSIQCNAAMQRWCTLFSCCQHNERSAWWLLFILHPNQDATWYMPWGINVELCYIIDIWSYHLHECVSNEILISLCICSVWSGSLLSMQFYSFPESKFERNVKSQLKYEI